MSGKALEWAVWAAQGFWGSLLAVVRTTAVWTAFAVVAVGMFALGHAEGQQGKRELRASVRDLTADRDRLSVELKAMAARAARAEEDLAVMLATAATPVAKVAPPATKPRRQPKPKPAATSWWSF